MVRSARTSGSVIKINHETPHLARIKQLSPPRKGIEVRYPVDARFTRRVTNHHRFGAFVELEPGFEA